MSLNRTNTWVAGTVVVCVLLSVAAWFLLIAPTRAEAAQLRDTTATTAMSNDQLAAEIETLKAQFETIEDRRAELADVREAMPIEPKLADLNRKLEAEAAAAGVTLMRVAPGAAAPVVTAAPLPAAPVEGEAGATGETGAVAAPAPSSTLLSIPLTIDVVGPFADVSSFLQAVQTDLGRDVLVQSLSVLAEDAAPASGAKPAVANGDVSLTLTGQIFVLPGAPVDAAPAATGIANS